MKEYTLLSSLSVVVVVALDFLVGTRLVLQRRYWLFLGVMSLGMVVVNGYLTARPIVLYGESMFSTFRLLTIPVEDFLFGFSLITLTIVVWEAALRQGGAGSHGLAGDSGTIHTLLRRQIIPIPRPDVFSFFSDPENLARITPRWLAFHSITPSPVRIAAGCIIDYTIRWLGLPVRWRTLIVEFDPPHRFIDEQVRGPYALWQHTHTFIDHGGVTEMIDRVRYRLPMGLAGRIMHHLVVRHHLREIFDYRAAMIEQLLHASIVPAHELH